MRQNLKITLLLILTSYHSFSQNALIIDNSTGKPINDVFVYHEDQNSIAYSDEKGIADLTNFPTGLVFFQHPSYVTQSVSYTGNELRVSLEEKIMSFNEVVISANKWEQEEEDVSQQIMSVNKKTIQFQNPQTSADLLASSGQVFVQKSQLGGGSPKIRGFSANSVLLVVDGVRMNNAIFRGGNLQNVINVDANALESSEVIFGPGSVIYGSDALGGVMDFHTITPDWSSDEITDISANILTRYGSAANERTGHIDFSIAKRKVTLFHSTTYTAFDDLRAGSNRSSGYKNEFERPFYVERIDGSDRLVENTDIDLQRSSAYDLFNTITKLKFRLSDDLDASYGFYFSTTSNIPRYDRLTLPLNNSSDSLEIAEWYYGPQKWMMHNARLNYYKSNRLFDQVRLNIAFQKFEESRNDRDFGDDRLRSRTEEVDMYSIALDFDKEFSNSNLYYGLDFFYNDVESVGIRRNLVTDEITSVTPRYPDGGSSYTSFAIYGSYVNRLSEIFTLNTGLRLNSVSLSGSTSNEDAISFAADDFNLSNTALNGSLGLVANTSEKNKFSLNLSTGFRSPNIDDVGKVFEIDDNTVVVPNENLSPEYTFSNELSYQRKSDRLLIQVVGFYSRLYDAIVRGPYQIANSTASDTLQVRAQVNADQAEAYGASLLVRAELTNDLALSNTITYTDGQDLSNGEPLRHASPTFGRFSLSHRSKKFRSEFFIDYNLDYTLDDIPLTEINDKPNLYTATGTPGWFTLNLRSSYQFNKYLNLNVGIENVLDTHYRPYSSGISAPGRNITLSIRGSF
ncbi:MAG: TonB-dependent receptor [Ekhidna sp.]|nr:TonB-dependent receptor [Ekhidna sp.]